MPFGADTYHTKESEIFAFCALINIDYNSKIKRFQNNKSFLSASVF